MQGLSAIGLAALAAAMALGFSPDVAAAQAPEAPPLFRVILQDGTALVSFGEYSRVGDRVIFPMPIGDPALARLQMVNLPASAVNWESTDRYAESTRYAQYVATRAEADYAMLTGEIAQALQEAVLAKDPARRLQIAEQARRLVAGWPADHYGYRSADVRELSTLLEETISDLRAAAGVQQFDFSLVAMIQPPTMPRLPDPSPAQAIEQALVAARAADVPAERATLIRAVIAVLEEDRARLPADWARRTRASAEAWLRAELETERKYAELRESALRTASKGAAAADVRGVERAMRSVERRDTRLGRQRPNEIRSLIATLQEKLDSARRLRLMRDQWALRSPALRAYRETVSDEVKALQRLRGRLDDIRSLAGPPVADLPALASRLERISRRLAILKPPAELAAVHATLLAAADLGQQAVRTRSRAAVTGDVKAAWDASAAASGSVMMLAQALQQIDQLSRPPVFS